MKQLAFFAICLALGASAAIVPNPSIHSIRTSGGIYLDTGVKARTGTKIELVAEWHDVTGDYGVFGARTGDTRFYPIHLAKGQLGYGFNDYHYLTKEIAPDTVYTIVSDFEDAEQTITVDGGEVYHATSTQSLSLDTTLALNAILQDGKPDYYGGVTVYSCKIWQDGVLVRDYKPDFRNNQAGLYDAVDGSFNPASGKYDFVPVPRWTSGAPDAYVEWIASSAGTHAIDTQIRAKSDLVFEGKMQWREINAVPNGREYTYLGAYRSKQNYLAALHVVSNQMWFAYGNGSDYGTHRFYLTHADGSPATVAAGTDHEFRAVMANGEQSLVWDGETIHSGTLAHDVDFYDDIVVFAAGSYNGFSNNSSARCYWLKIWQDGKLVRDLVPAVKNGEGVLYDRVDDICLFSWNAIGPGNIGPATTTPQRPVSFCEYIGSNGRQYIDTGIEGRDGTKIEATLAWSAQTGDEGVIGSRKDMNSDSRFYPIHYYNNLCYGYGVFYHISGGTVTVPLGEKHTISADLEAGSQTVVLDGETIASGSVAAEIKTGRPMYLFAENVAGTANYFSKVRVYELKIWQDGELARHFVPVIADNGMPCLWDNVSKALFYSETDTDLWDSGDVLGRFGKGTILIMD